ncbi:CaiB/BaiF CoA transferase family protein [Rhodococcus opacus]|uniref:CaiB/BaiF CoA transferase family protein n=1 Tax=Rhodococcus opacus TaxID=37919 RepID=UPI001C489F3C|nr:CoA transferase [Rhodococcus opacus]MBV6756681.1 CoA transferase [Rhodococcus opacus]
MQQTYPSSRGEGTAGPLAGLRVVDLTTSYAGPTATMYLADLGADVVKIERPGGDEARDWGPPFVGETSAWFASANRNKRSIVLDLKAVEGLEVLYRLIDEADVLVENFNPTKLARLGLDPGVLRARNPRLIYCAMTGFGLDGPDNGQPGYDLAAQARSGLMSVTGAMDGSPQRVSTALSDIVTGMCAALAICAAAVKQRSEGVGDLVDVSLLDSDLALMAPRIAAYLAGEPEPRPSGGSDSVLAVYQTFQTLDRDIAVAIGNEGIWQRFCRALELTDLAEAPDLQSNGGRRARRPELVARIAEQLVQRNAADWLKILAEAGVPASLVQGLSEVVNDAQVTARASLIPVDSVDGLFGVRSPFRLASVPQLPGTAVPRAGEHTHEILRECGFDADQIEGLANGKVVQLGTEGAVTNA